MDQLRARLAAVEREAALIRHQLETLANLEPFAAPTRRGWESLAIAGARNGRAR